MKNYSQIIIVATESVSVCVRVCVLDKLKKIDLETLNWNTL